MTEISVRQLSTLLLGAAMIAVGLLGYSGAFTIQRAVVGAILVVVALLSFYIGQTSAQPRRV